MRPRPNTDLPSPSGMAIATQLPKVIWGKGIYVHDANGRRYIDASGGPAVFCLGHANDEVNDAIKRQLDQIAYGYRYTFTSDALEELRALVAEACGPGLDSMLFCCGGSEAVESALKIALQYHTARGEMSRRRFVARRRSWHGNTLGALSVSDFLVRRAPFEGALIEASFVSAVRAYRPPPGVAVDELAEYCAQELEAEIERVGPERVAAFIFEPVVGAAGGVVPAPPTYAERVRRVCDRHGVLLIADEVMCGAGRCGTWRALEHDGVVPDIMAVAKGLGAGYLPLGATVYHRRVAEVIDRHDGGPLTGHTFTGHTTACAAGVAVQRIVKRDGLVARVRRDGPAFQARVTRALEGIEAVGDIRGRGFFLGIELVADRASKTPFAPALHVATRIGQTAAASGLLCYPSSGNIDGVNGDTVILAPPYISSDAELDEIAGRFGDAVREALKGIRRA
jgi:adenosylmethionine-8-amino-7-oxononanoate aminotransferase